MKAFRNLRLIGAALLLLALIGTAGFHFIEGWTWFDGLYMIVTTFTTIGYQEIHPLSHAGRIFNLALIVAGVSLVFLGIGALTQALLEFELRSFFGKRKMEREIGRLIEQNEAKAARYTGDWLTVIGDATQEQTLRDVHIERARGLVAATTTDATNLYIVLTARGLNPRLKIIARASEDDAEKHLLTAGADSVVSPYHFAGQRIAQSFLRPHVVSFLDTATTHLGMDLEIGEIQVGPSSEFAGKTVGASRLRQERGVIILAIKREQGMRFNPSPEDRIEPGDYLIAMGEPGQLRQLEQMAVARS